MRRLIALLLLALACNGYAAADNDVDEHGVHHHGGPPPKGMTLVSLALSSAGAVLVSSTLLALLWKPIDVALLRSRFRSRWQQRGTRVAFAAVFVVVAVAMVASAAYLLTREEERTRPTAEAALLEAKYGGEVKQVGHFLLELVPHRTGEVRLYITVLAGQNPSLWDIKPQLSLLPGTASTAATNPIPMKGSWDSIYFVAVIPPPAERQIRIHLSIRIFQDAHEIDFNPIVRD